MPYVDISFYLVAIIANYHIDERCSAWFLFVRDAAAQDFFGKNS
jgi:hypothetical protein